MTDPTPGDDIDFAGPPPATAGPGSTLWSDRLDQLRARPGEWARFPTNTSSAAASAVSRIKAGDAHYVEEGEFDATSRTLDGQYFVYARYVGGEAS